MKEQLEALARKVENDPFFLAGVLTLFARSEGLDEAGLLARLGCGPDILTALRLCRTPRINPHGFREDIARLAEHFSLSAETLAQVVRRGQALQRLQAAPGGEPGSLLAAREAEEKLPPSHSSEEGSP